MIRHKAYSFINITGLAIGICCCLLIFLFVVDELSYDKYHEKGDRIIRMTFGFSSGNQGRFMAPTSYRLADALKTDFPELESVVRIDNNSWRIKYKENEFRENRVFIADPEIFNVFSFKLITGNADEVLLSPFTAVISESIAEKYFGGENPIGKSFRVNNSFDLMVTGIMENIPRNSHFIADFFVSMETGKQIYNQNTLNNWGEITQYTYVLLPETMSQENFQAKLPEFVVKQFGATRSTGLTFTLQPMTDIHLKSHLESEITPNSDIRYIYIFSSIAILIVLLACFNYMNLATARYTVRSREVGMRKVFGANRFQISRQFLSESMLLTLFSFSVAVILAGLVLPQFNQLSGKAFTFSQFFNPLIIVGGFIFAVMVGVLAGSYPSFYLSKFQPALVLKSKLSLGAQGSFFRRSLVFLQFGISISLIIGTIVINQQVRYLQNMNTGINKENVIIMPTPGNVLQNYETFKTELLQKPSIINVTASNKRIAVGRLGSNLGFSAEGYNNPNGVNSFRVVTMDHDFFKTLGIKPIAGRDFSKEYASDANEGFILNKTAVEIIGWTPETAIGKWFQSTTLGIDGAWQQKRGSVIGVVDDFNYESLYNEIKPVAFFISPNWLNWMTVRINGANITETIAAIENTWQKFDTQNPFNFTFLDEDINALYNNEKQFLNIISIFTFLSLVVAGLGILGLASFTAEQRTKEIGIRRVLGASVTNILGLMSKDFLGVVLLSNIVAIPAAYIIMDQWLNNFLYRMDFSVWIFFGAAASALILALVTVSSQAIKSALLNPVDTIRYE